MMSVSKGGGNDTEITEGLPKGHAYSITKIVRAEIKTGLIHLIRIRNPWGSATEWKGAWSDGSKEWEDLTKEHREHLGLIFESDGEFFISLKDFMKQFHRESILNSHLHKGKGGIFVYKHCIDRLHEMRRGAG